MWFNLGWSIITGIQSWTKGETDDENIAYR
jgi:hypothetical protein